MADYSDGYWWSKDGLRLHYRDYPGRDGQGQEGRPPILCIPGLTRNARDFAAVAERLAGEWRVICVELRGRGESAYAKDPLSYAPLVYLQDVEALIGELGLECFVVFGTSLGGIIAMLLAGTGPGRIAGVLLNDIGPVLEARGLDRIKGYVGRSASWPTWLHAARAIAESNAAIYPDYTIEDWLGMAKRLCRLNASGRIVVDYDMRIADPMKLPGADAAFDMWPPYEVLRGAAGLIVRGALSDLLAEETAAEMVARLPEFELLTVTRVGHAPTLAEPEVAEAIDRLLAKVAKS